jgi:demethylmenaquinone methyltransferase/2-methoxy-6-polyprenyl-1,4-benzoquinol methylase
MATTHFGFESVDERTRRAACAACSTPSRSKYDLMNDLMSMGPAPRLEGLHGDGGQPARGLSRVLDIAGGTGDLALAFAKKVGSSGQVVHTDINEAMLRTGRDRLLDAGVACPRWSATPKSCLSRRAF